MQTYVNSVDNQI